MNKKIKEFFENKGFVIINNNAYGKIHDFEASVNVNIMDNYTPVQIFLNFYASESDKRNIVNGLQKLQFKYFRYQATAYGIILGFNGLTIASLMKQLDNMLDQIVLVIKSNNTLGYGYCPLCGKEINEETSKQCQIEWYKVTLDNECISNVNAAITEENKEYDDAPNNYLKGTIGAIIGAFAGALAMIILLLLNFIAAISAFVAVWLGAILYKSFGGKQNKGMIVIVSVTSILSQLLTMFLLYVYTATLLAGDYGFSSSGMQAFMDMMTNAEFSGEFTSNMIMVGVFSILGIGSYVAKLVKATKRPGAIK